MKFLLLLVLYCVHSCLSRSIWDVYSFKETNLAQPREKTQYHIINSLFLNDEGSKNKQEQIPQTKNYNESGSKNHFRNIKDSSESSDTSESDKSSSDNFSLIVPQRPRPIYPLRPRPPTVTIPAGEITNYTLLALTAETSNTSQITESALFPGTAAVPNTSPHAGTPKSTGTAPTVSINSITEISPTVPSVGTPLVGTLSSKTSPADEILPGPKRTPSAESNLFAETSAAKTTPTAKTPFAETIPTSVTLPVTVTTPSTKKPSFAEGSASTVHPPAEASPLYETTHIYKTTQGTETTLFVESTPVSKASPPLELLNMTEITLAAKTASTETPAFGNTAFNNPFTEVITETIAPTTPKPLGSTSDGTTQVVLNDHSISDGITTQTVTDKGGIDPPFKVTSSTILEESVNELTSDILITTTKTTMKNDAAATITENTTKLVNL